MSERLLPKGLLKAAESSLYCPISNGSKVTLSTNTNDETLVKRRCVLYQSEKMAEYQSTCVVSRDGRSQSFSLSRLGPFTCGYIHRREGVEKVSRYSFANNCVTFAFGTSAFGYVLLSYQMSFICGSGDVEYSANEVRLDAKMFRVRSTICRVPRHGDIVKDEQTQVSPGYAFHVRVLRVWSAHHAEIVNGEQVEGSAEAQSVGPFCDSSMSRFWIEKV